MTRTPLPVARVVFPGLLVAGVLLVALNLRGPLVAVSPIIRTISADLGLSTTTAGLLTSLPVLCFAVTTPLAAWIIRRAGAEWAVLVCVLGVLVGTAIRSSGGTAVVILGTVVIGASITVGNIVLPVVIRRDVPAARRGVVTGGYTAALNVGSMITSLGTAPLAALLGWRWALLTWGSIAVIATLVWIRYLRRHPPAAAALLRTTQDEPLRSATLARTGWLLTGAFCGQAFSYYAITAWLPSLLSDETGLGATAAGAISSIFQIAAVIGALGIPLLTARSPSWLPLGIVAAFWCAMPLGLLLAPQAYVLWAGLGGVAQGGGFVCVFAIIMRISRSDREATRLSARVQAGGYLAAAAGPLVIGALHGATDGWRLPLLAVLVTTTAYGVFGVSAALREKRAA